MNPFNGNMSRDRAMKLLLDGESYRGEFAHAIQNCGQTTLSGTLGPSFEHRTTLLHVAVAKRRTNAVRYLLEAGADYSAVDFAGRTPYDIAVQANDYTILKIFQDFTLNSQIHETQERVDELTDSVRALKRRRTALEEDNSALKKKNYGLAENNTELRRSARLAAQREKKARQECLTMEKDRDLYRKRYETMRDKVFKK